MIMVMSVVVAGVPYLVFAIGMWFALARESATSAVPRCIRFAPLLFLPVEAIALLMWSAYTEGIGVNILAVAFLLVPISLYTVVLGYLYVGLATLPYLLLRRAGYIRVANAV
jgi:hypothetical protein